MSPAIDISERVPPVSAKAVAAPVAVKAAPGELVRAYAAFSGWRLRCRFKRRLFICFMPCVAKLSRSVSLMVAALPLFLVVRLVNFIEGVRNLVQKH